jgi:P-type E1-E2 ATPase
VEAQVNGKTVYVGHKSWVETSLILNSEENLGYTSETHAEAHISSQLDVTIVYVGVQGLGVVGALHFSDAIRPESRESIQRLMDFGMQVMILTGDENSVGLSVARKVGISEGNVQGSMKPSEKAIFIENLKSTGHHVAMIGDGVNDTIALGVANVGMAMGGGSDAAGATANVVLLGNSLTQVADAFALGRATLNKIKQNLLLAVIYNGIGIPVAAGMLLPKYGIALTPAVAASMMAISSIVVVGNSLVLREGATLFRR